MAKAKKQVDVEFIQVTVLNGNSPSFELRADEEDTADPGTATYTGSRAGCDPKSVAFLKEVLDKIANNYCTGTVTITVRGFEIVPD